MNGQSRIITHPRKKLGFVVFEWSALRGCAQVGYVKGIITIETKNNLIHTACVSELGKRMEKIKRDHPGIKIDMDFSYHDRSGGSITFMMDGDDEELIKKEIKMSFAEKLQTKLMKKWVRITSEIKAR